MEAFAAKIPEFHSDRGHNEVFFPCIAFFNIPNWQSRGLEANDRKSWLLFFWTWSLENDPEDFCQE